MRTTYLTSDDVMLLLSRRLKELGNQKALAAEVGVSQQYISDIVTGKRPPAAAILQYLRLETVTLFRVRR